MSFSFNQGYPGGNDTYVPTLELSGNLMVSFSRNVKRYPVTRYAGITPVKQPRGAYLLFNPSDAIRMNNLPQGLEWAPGTLGPVGFANTLGFQQQTYLTKRYSEAIMLDQRSIDIANWPIMKSHTEGLAQKMMTHRAYQVCTKMTTAGNYPSGNVFASGTAAGGGPLDAGTTSNPYIYNTFSNVVLLIQALTGGRIKRGDIFALGNAKTFTRMSRSREIREYLMQNPEAFRMIQQKKGDGWSENYGLPQELYTTTTICEDMFFNTNNRGAATDTNSPVFPDGTLFFGVREQDLESAEGAANYSTIQVFIYEDMNVETFTDQEHRYTKLRTTDEFDVQVAAPITGVIVQNVFT
jgi:hypothetical protein